MELTFVHGSGRAGRAAWPAQVDVFPDAGYLALPGFGGAERFDFQSAVALVAERGTGVVVASSFGGLIAARAAAITRPRGLVLAEPALYALARGKPAVEDLVARMDPIYRRGAGASAGAFWAEAMTELTGSAVPEPRDAVGIEKAALFRDLGAPWSHRVDQRFPDGVAAVVVTGDWNDEYEQIAEALVENGARHVRLPGFGHRVADHPEFNSIVREFAAVLD